MTFLIFNCIFYEDMFDLKIRYSEFVSFLKDNSQLKSPCQRKNGICDYLIERFTLNLSNEEEIYIKECLTNSFLNNLKSRLSTLPKGIRNFAGLQTRYSDWLDKFFHCKSENSVNVEINGT